MQNLTALRTALFAVMFILVLPPHRVAAQYAFQDAVNIEAALKGPLSADGAFHVLPKPAYFAILKKYVPSADSNNDAAIEADFAKNPFLQIDAKMPLVDLSRNPATASSNSIAGLDVTSIANGVAALLIDRAKQELTIAFFNRFQAFVNKNQEFGILFPTTTANLGKLLSYAYPQMLPVLRNGFLSDLRALPVDMAGLLDIPKYDSLFKKYPALAISLRSMRSIANLQSGASTPAGVFDEFAHYPEIQHPEGNAVLKNIAATIRLADLFSQSLRSGQPDKIWVTPAALKPLLSDAVLQTIYRGLIWQSANTSSIYFYSGASDSVAFTTLLSQQQSTYPSFLSRVNAFVVLGNQVANALTTINSNAKNGKSTSNADYYNYIGAAIDAIDTAFGIIDLFKPGLNAKPYLNLVRTGNSIYKDIYSQQYTQAISDGIDLIDSIGTLAGVSPSKQPPDALQALAAFAEKGKPYVIFMGNLLEATSSADVQAALDNAILPVGSSSIKKNTRNNIAVQAYLGAYAVVGPNNTNATGVWSDRWGVTAPIGIAYTPGFLSRGKLGSLSLFLEAFDLGAIVDYQLKTDTVTGSNGTPTTAFSKSYSVKLGQILSPGVYVVYGAGANLPLALSFGGQYGPGLSKINASGQAIVANPSWRWNFTLTVDLPLFNLLNVSRTTQRK